MRSSLLAVLLVLLLAGRAAQAFLAPVPAGAGEACSSSICSSSSSRGARHAHGWISGGRARIRHSVCVTASQTQEQQIRRYYHTWQWRDRYNINYRVEGPETGEPVLLVHGFGASLGHFRKNIPAFVERGYRVYAIDLLGFGGSDKPSDVESFSLELWRDLVVDFIRAHPSPRGAAQWVLCGNSIGSLISLMAAAELPGLVKACVLFNTSGGLVSFRDDELPLIFRPIWWFFRNVVLSDQLGPSFFKNFKTRENVQAILTSQAYGVKDAVTDELLDILLAPSDDEGACQVFLKVLRGDAGPTPESVLPRVENKVLAIWGEADQWTPVDSGLHPGTKLAANFPEKFELVRLPGVGHCPHDEAEEECHSILFDWLRTV